jgi:FkbM family methyltransferase
MDLRAQRLTVLAKMAAQAAQPLGVSRAVEARRMFRARGYGDVTLKAALHAWMARVHLLPADIDLRHGRVVDIGANEGAFSAGVLAVAPQAEIVAAEPGPAPRARLQARLGRLPNVEIHNVAVSSSAGVATFHLTAHDHNSSLHAPRAEMQEMIDPGWTPAGELSVRTVTLDELVGDRTVDVLKIDVQGSELDVLRGGDATLARARSVLLEMNFQSQYEGDATFNTLHAEMDRRGFALVNVSPTLTTRDGTAIFIDGCYVRRGVAGV